MDENTLETLIRKYLSTQQYQYIFSWQGGEPMLMGFDFYKRVIKLQKEYASTGSVIGNGLQTNGLVIDESWAEFLSQSNFLVGISLDGPEYIHNKFRVFPGKNAFEAVMKAIEILKRYNVEFNTLTVVSSAHKGKAKEVYWFLKEAGSNFHQYIPCVEYTTDGKRLPWTIEGKEWGNFLCELFEAWVSDSQRVSIRLFDSVLLKLLKHSPGVCQMEGNCCQYFVIEHNGDVFPCDFFVRSSLLLGNIMKDDWEDFFNSERYINFGLKKSKWHPGCDRCEFLNLCMGDCQKHRIKTKKVDRPKSVLCEGWKIFYSRTLNEFKKLANQIKMAAEF